jgi:hypothetical protein
MMALTDMASGNVDGQVRLVCQNESIEIRGHRRPSSKEKSTFEHWNSSFCLKPPLLVQYDSCRHSCTLRISDDSIKRALLLHDPVKVIHSILTAVIYAIRIWNWYCPADSVFHQFAHLILSCCSFRKISNPVQYIAAPSFWPCWLDEAIVGTYPEEIFKTLGGKRFNRPMNEMQLSSVVRAQLFD